MNLTNLCILVGIVSSLSLSAKAAPLQINKGPVQVMTGESLKDKTFASMILEGAAAKFLYNELKSTPDHSSMKSKHGTHYRCIQAKTDKFMCTLDFVSETGRILSSLSNEESELPTKKPGEKEQISNGAVEIRSGGEEASAINAFFITGDAARQLYLKLDNSLDNGSKKNKDGVHYSCAKISNVYKCVGQFNGSEGRFIN